MKHSILLVVSKPSDTSYELENKWQECMYVLSDQASKNKDVLLLAENCLLLPLNHTLNILTEIVHRVVSSNFRYKYAILDEEIEWHEG